MSHLTKYHIKVTDIKTLKDSLEELQTEGRINYTWLGYGTKKLFSATTTGQQFQLKDWNYPICITNDGDVEFDNYEGKWGKEESLDAVINRYNEKVISETAKRQGWMVSSSRDTDGTVRLRLYQ